MMHCVIPYHVCLYCPLLEGTPFYLTPVRSHTALGPGPERRWSAVRAHTLVPSFGSVESVESAALRWIA